MAVNYYLKPRDNNKRCLVYLRFKYQGQVLNYSFGQTIDANDWDKKRNCPINWNEKTHRVKDNKTTTADGEHSLNDLLNTLATVCKKAYNDELKNGIPTPLILKKHLDDFVYKNVRKGKETEGPSLFKLIDRFISGEFGKKSPSTIKSYNTSKTHLASFQTATKYAINFNSIGLDFKYAYVKYLAAPKKVKKKTVKGLATNSIKKEIKNVKTFMNMAVELGYTTNLDFKKKLFGVKEVETDAIYLTEKEIRNLYRFDFSKNKRLETVRDMFVFSCFVGLRYSDASRIKAENIVKIDGENYIKITSQKTGQPVVIPCNDIVLKIFKKYNPLPAAITNQKFNQYLKELCMEAKMVETGRLASDLALPLYEAISSHTARRSFATNCYLSGMDTRMIMGVTGHTTEKSFEKYIKVTREENAKRMGAHMKKDLSKNILKAVS